MDSGPEDSPRGWKSVDEPELEYDDETGLDLEAHDGGFKPRSCCFLKPHLTYSRNFYFEFSLFIPV